MKITTIRFAWVFVSLEECKLEMTSLIFLSLISLKILSSDTISSTSFAGGKCFKIGVSMKGMEDKKSNMKVDIIYEYAILRGFLIWSPVPVSV